MRRLRRQPGQDSLDLLLDTLCNVFGGIILITCLLALMNHKKIDAPQKSSLHVGHGQLIEQRLLAATDELKRIEELHVKIQSMDDAETRLLSAERLELQKTLDRLRDEKTETVSSVGSPVVTVPAREVLGLKSKVDEARAKLAEASSEESALKARATEITARIAEIEKKIGDVEKTRTRKLRFPKERPHVKNSRFILIKDGAIYPVYLPDGKVFPGVEKRVISEHENTIEPRSGRGWTVENHQEKISSYLSQVNRASEYISLIIYRDDDSFQSFQTLKEWIIKQGLDYGFSVNHSKKPVTFTTKGGTSAPPL